MEEKCLFNPKMVGVVPEIAPEELLKVLGQAKLIDVRRPDEFNGELSHIPGAKLVTLGPELDAFLKERDKNDELVFVCRSGGRSGQATMQAIAAGLKKSVNLQGGMLLWNERKLPLEKQS